MKHICIDIEMSDLTCHEKRLLPGLQHEVIQIGAVMLDESYNLESTFSAQIKPAYSHVSPFIQELTGLTNEMLEDCDDFVTVFDKYADWLGGGEITTYCWSSSDYKQLSDELYLKARHREDLFEPLKSFVDLQKSFGDVLGAKAALSLDTALKFAHCDFVGKRHNALADAFNTARVLRKLATAKSLNPCFENLYSSFEKSLDEGLCAFGARFSGDEYTTSFAAFMPPELLAKYSLAAGKGESRASSGASPSPLAAGEYPLYAAARKSKALGGGILRLLSRCFRCTRYGVSVKSWFVFSVRTLFARDFLFCSRRPNAKFKVGPSAA